MTTILVVDDSAVDRRAAGGLLSKTDEWTVEYASDGAEALEQMRSAVPDLVVSDLVMPVMDGLELVRAAQREFPLVPVILMTGKGNEAIAVEALRLGAASYVTKRRLSRDLTETVRLVLDAACRDRSDVQLMQYLTSLDVAFSVQNDLAILPSAVHFLLECGARVGLFCDDQRVHVGVALEEALMNAYYHGNLELASQLRIEDYKAYYDLARRRLNEPRYRDRRIHISGNFTTGAARYTIRDEGPGFDPASVPPPIDPGQLDRAYGRGLLLMHTFMDEVSFNAGGNEVTLTKRRILPSNCSVDRAGT